MSAALSKAALQFLRDLKDHNDRDWFTDHKDEFVAAQAEFVALCQSLLDGIAEFDPSVRGVDAKSCVFRIYRDARFAKDKSPYKTNFGALLGPKGCMGTRAGYYLHVEPDASFLGGGVYRVDSKVLYAVRQHISEHSAAFLKMVGAAEFNKLFKLEGDKLSKVPQGFTKEDPVADYLKYKNFAIVYAVPDKTLTSAKVMAQLLPVYRAMQPFNRFINQPLAG